jgi:hypothetical protein
VLVAALGRASGPERLAEAAAGLAEWSTSLAVEGLVEVAAAAERLAAWARAVTADVAAELATRDEMRPVFPARAGRVAEPCFAASELSLRLGVTRRAADTLVRTGTALRAERGQTGHALASGDIDWPKARVLVDGLAETPLEVGVEVESRVLPTAGSRTPTQLAREVERALLEVDPEDAKERHGRARRGRYVGRPRVLPDGMASLTAVLPAAAAVQLDACLQSAAEAAIVDGDDRTTDQLRADALSAMAESAWLVGRIGPGAEWSLGPCHDGGAAADAGRAPADSGSLDTGCPDAGPRDGTGALHGLHPSDRAVPTSARRRTRRRRTTVSVSVGIGTLLGLDDRPGELAGYGPVGADVAQALARDGTWRRLLVDEPSGAVLDVGTRRYRPGAELAELVEQRNRTCVVPTCATPSWAADLDHTVPFDRGRKAPGSQGDGDRRTDAEDGTDRDDGMDGDVGTDRDDGDGRGDGTDRCDGKGRGDGHDGAYSNDGTARNSGTGRAQGNGGSDTGGTTSPGNLGPLCRTHHLFKTAGGYRLEQPTPGSFVVRTPSGHTYLQGPDRPPGVPTARDDGRVAGLPGWARRLIEEGPPGSAPTEQGEKFADRSDARSDDRRDDEPPF